jgi:hypothetical protein
MQAGTLYQLKLPFFMQAGTLCQLKFRIMNIARKALNLNDFLILVYSTV